VNRKALGARGYAGPPEQAGRAFLKAHKDLFGIANVQRGLEVARTNRSGDGSNRVQYRQMHRGIPVLNSGYLVALNQEGAVHYVSGDYYPNLRVDTSPKLQASDVVETMRSDLGDASSFAVRQEPALSVFVDDSGEEQTVFVDDSGEEQTAHLAYEGRAERRDPLKAYKYVVDAHSGEILQKISLIETIGRPERPHETTPPEPEGHHSPASSASGSGDVYLTNPLHGSPSSVTLHRLDNASPQVLEGGNIAVTNEEASDATSSTGDFTYSSSNTHFDEVMTYYHSDEFEAWLIGDLGMGTSQLDCQVSAETHSSQGYAFTFPGNCEAFFSDGDDSFFGNPTRERSIIDHEYMHIVSETYNGLNQDFDAGALDEGYSDFFAVADRHANTGVSSARLGAYVGLEPERTVDNTYQLSDFKASYPQCDLNDSGSCSEHDGGVVLAGALWDFKQRINDPTLAAEITLESLNYLDGDPSFLDARNAVLTAADVTGNSQFKCDVRDAFADHGIGTALYAGVSGPTSLDEGELGTWNATASCPNGPLSYTWYVDSGGGFYQVGTGSSLTWGKDQISSTLTVDIKVVASAGGESDAARTQVLINNNGGGGGCSGVSTNQICLSASGEKAKSSKNSGQVLPDTLQVGKVTPTPARVRAELQVALPQSAKVRIGLYNMLGQLVERRKMMRSAGRQRVPIDLSQLSSGVYFARVTVGTVTKTRRIVVVR